MIKMDMAQYVVMLCALEYCLTGQSFVDYCVRDYVRSNIKNMTPTQKKDVINLIFENIENVRDHKKFLWNNIIEELN